MTTNTETINEEQQHHQQQQQQQNQQQQQPEEYIQYYHPQQHHHQQPMFVPQNFHMYGQQPINLPPHIAPPPPPFFPLPPGSAGSPGFGQYMYDPSFQMPMMGYAQPFGYNPDITQQYSQQRHNGGGPQHIQQNNAINNNSHSNNHNNSHNNHNSHNRTKKFNPKSESFIPSKSHEAYLNPQIQQQQQQQQPLQNLAPQTVPIIPPQQPSPQPSSQHVQPKSQSQSQSPQQSQPQQQLEAQSKPQLQPQSSDVGSQEDTNNIKFITAPTTSPSRLISSNALTTINTTQKDTKDVDSLKLDGSNLIFKISSENDLSLPLIFGTTLNELQSQKKKYNKDNKEEEQQESDEDNKKQVEVEKSQHEIKESSQPTSTPTTTTTTSTPKAMAWSSIAQKAAQKPIKSSTPSPSTSNPSTPSNTSSSTSKREESIRFVPTISNVLEPLGVVLLRSMFDKNFQKFTSNSKIPSIVPRGIVNTGNICFMSSILQLLLYCQPFYKSLNIISNKTLYSMKKDSKTQLFDSIINFYKYFNIKVDSIDEKLKKNKNKKFGDAITPTELYQSISSNERFQHLKWGQQEDAEEFFGYLLDGLHEEFISSIERITEIELKNLLNSITSDETRNLIKQIYKKFHEDDLNSTTTTTTNQSTSSLPSSRDLISDDGWTEVSNTKAGKTSAKRTVEVKPSPIKQLFGGQFRSVLTVPKQKESRSITVDPFQQIQLDISDDSIHTLEEAFLKISEIEEIPMKSSNGEDVIATKQTYIDKLPEVLIIHLKRFSFNFSNNNQNTNSNYPSSSSNNNNIHNGINNNSNGHYGRGRIEKLTKKIEYKHELTIPTKIISPTNRAFIKDLNYKLTGVVYHIGSSSDGGHYIVDVLSDDGWLSIDDTNISELKPEQVLEKDGVQSAYILMYQRV